jgi:surfactin synthase thioesterase subunit
MHTTTGSWLLRTPPETGPLLFGLPYGGGGASMYRRWPERIGDAWFGALQMPGRESRFREPAIRTHAEFADAMVAFLDGFAGRPFAFFGHCGGVPLALSTILALQDRGAPLPRALIASSWGAPHRGLYGVLNFVDLATVDLIAESTAVFERLGVPPRPDFVEVAAEVLRADLELHRPYRHPADRRVPVPVVAVGWTGDDVVPPAVACEGWDEVADVGYRVLDGDHFAFTGCPPALAELMADVVAR